MPEYVLILIKADNTAAECWAKKASSSSVIGKSLMCLQAALMIQYGIGVNAAYISGKLKTIPDYISRELLSLIYNIVLNTHTP
eukprot:8228010-Ditylum_brightwellii.AAC.1